MNRWELKQVVVPAYVLRGPEKIYTDQQAKAQCQRYWDDFQVLSAQGWELINAIQLINTTPHPPSEICFIFKRLLAE